LADPVRIPFWLAGIHAVFAATRTFI